jgi:hypothetical protein
MELERWLQDAMQIVGVGSNYNIIHFWRSSRTSDDDSDMSLVNCRYMVWFVQYVLLHHLMMNEHNDEENDDDPMVDYGKYMIQLVEIYHNCGLQLLNKNSFTATTTTTNNNDQQEISSTAGVMWQMILQNVNLTPEELRDYYYTYNEQRLGCSNNGSTPPNNLDILSLLFAWPSFLQYATAHATAATTTKKQSYSSSSSSQMNKRRRISSNESDEEDWWSIFGYYIGHVILSSSPTTSCSTMNKVQYLKEYTCTKLPVIMMNIGNNNKNNYNYNTNSHMKNLLLCGIAASVIDEVGEYTILDGLLLDDIDNSNNNMNNNVEEDITSQSSRPSVGDIVDLLLMDAG